LVRRLLRGSATVPELIRAAEAEQGAEAYPPAADLAVKHDLQSLRDEFGCVISYQRAQRVYILEELGDLALLDLPDDALEALAFLDATFPDDAPIGGNDRVRLLIGRMFALLPAVRRDAIGRRFTLPRMTWSASYTEDVKPQTLDIIQQAISLQRQLTFEYSSNYDTDSQSRQYQVAPYLVYFRDGHTYLDSTVLQPPPDRDKLLFRAIQFRLDRIVPGKIRMAHESIPNARPSQPVYEVIYTLAPAVARNRDVAHWFPETTVDYQDDGSALVKGYVTNLWQARQILMRYIEHCQVLEPPELVEMMRQTVAKMAALYTVLPSDYVGL
jgi:predicted DNA-binding transcriptional regulator YafY